MNQELEAAERRLKENERLGSSVTKQVVLDLITVFGGEEHLKEVLSRTDNYNTPERWAAAAIIALGLEAHQDEPS